MFKNMFSQKIGRRNFLGMAGVAGISAMSGAIPAGGLDSGKGRLAPGFPPVGPHQEGGEADWREIDRLHKEQVDKFLANIGQDPLFWDRDLEYTIGDDGVKEFRVTAEEVDWETDPGNVFPAFAYNGIVPGPTLRCTQNERVRVIFTNNMNESTGIHFHGLDVPNDIDGVPFITQPPIEPGQTYTYEFAPKNYGSHMYHSHHNAAEQVVRGLAGAFIVEPEDKSREPQVAADYVIMLNDSGLGYTINGKSFPSVQPIIANLGDRVRIRYMNEGLMIHPMHLHGMPQLVFAKDGFPLPQPYMCDTLNIAPGERYDVLVDATHPGLWAFHCHILTHAESRQGLFGMTTVFVVNE